MQPRLRRWWTRRIRGFPLRDLALAGVFMVVAVTSALTGHPDEGPLAVTVPVALVMTGSLAWRTRSPVVCAVAVTAAGLAQTLLSQAPGSLWSLVVLIVVMYSVAAHYPEGTAALIGLGMLGLLLLQEHIDNGVDYVFITVLFGGTWLLGRSSRLWLGRIRTVEREHDRLAQLAVADERLRIARELHDTLAHSLTVIAVQAEAAEAALDHDDPQLAREPVSAITASARRSLAEIRAVLHGLRDAEPELRPLVGLADLGELTRSVRRTGVDVEEHVATGSGPVPAAIDRAAYRIVQEALTNVVKHAPGAAVTLRIERRDAALWIDVENGPSEAPRGAVAGSGVGLVGIAERASAVGGRLEAGPTGQGFRVRVALPLEPEPEQP